MLTCNLASKPSISENCTEDETSFLPLLTAMCTEEIESTEKNETTVECEEAVIPETTQNTNNIINNVKK